MQTPRPRQRNADPIQPQPRDRNAMLMIYYCDGLMSEEQLVRFCYKDTHPKNGKKRLLALFDNRYLNRNWKPERWQLYPKLLYWLASRGYDEVGQLLGAEVDRSNKMARSRVPATLIHHLEVVDVRLKIIEDAYAHEALNLGRWFTEGFFRSRSWQCKVKFKTAQGDELEEAVEPDGFFPIWRCTNEKQTAREVFSYILEIDRATEVQQSVSGPPRTTIDKKLRKGAELLHSATYRETFRVKGGRCLMVTSSWERAENMMTLAREAGVAWAWYFTTMEQVTDSGSNLLTDPVWRKANKDGLLPLIS